jgi:Icc-related predicted phosphoesterase
MKAWIFSDLHADVRSDTHGFKLPKPRPEHDVVIIAGDIGEDAVKSVKWIAHNCLHHKPVIFVRGNHESYRQAIDHNLEAAHAAIAETSYPHNIHLLENDFVDIDGVRFIGATLWTDYLLYGEENRRLCYSLAQHSMNDHKLIRMAKSGYSRFRTKEAYMAHMESRQHIERMLAEPFDGPRICVTHHAPSFISVPEHYKKDFLSAAYASHLDHLAEKADLWVHGHIHSKSRYYIGDCEVVCNPRGYVGLGEGTGFDPELVVEIPRISHRNVEAEESAA